MRASSSLSLSTYLLAADGLITILDQISLNFMLLTSLGFFQKLKEIRSFKKPVAPDISPSNTQNSLKTFLAMAFHVFSLAHNKLVIYFRHNSLTMSKMSKFITDQTTFSVFTNKRLLRDTRAREVYFLSFL